MSRKSRFSGFSDEEIYMLKRQAIEGSQEIIMTAHYKESNKKIHAKLLNELCEEDGHRLYGESKN